MDIDLKFEESRAKVEELKAEVNAVQELLLAEGQQIRAIGGHWTGAGRDAWEQRQREWQEEADELWVSLTRLARTANEGLDDMDATEKKVGGLFS